MTTSSIRIEDAYVLDTVALIRHLTEHKLLGEQAKTIFAAAEQGKTQLIISAMVVAEMYYASKKFDLFDVDFLEVYRGIQSQPQFQLVIFAPDDVLYFDLNESVPEMHDRIIAGLARQLGVPLITNDPKIADAGIVPTVW